jgi:acetylornithine deacetylase
MIPSPTTREILADLVAFDTTSRRSNLPLIEYVERYLAAYGVASRRISTTPDKANLWATVGPDRDGGVVLSGHTDCVPVDDQDWASDPFVLTERDGRLYGRGTSDMKGFLASVLALVPQLVDGSVDGPVHLAFSYDEEIGCFGVRDLLETLRSESRHPEFCLVGEPTGMGVVVGHKGGRAKRCTVRGLEAHSSLAPLGVNAIEHAAAIIAFIRSLADEFATGPTDEAFDMPHSTISVGMIEGGSAINVVPNRCSFVFECRNLPTVDQDELFSRIERYCEEQVLPRMRRIWDGASITFEPIYEYPAHEIATDHRLTALMSRITGRNSYGKVAFGTEAGLFQRELRVPTIICGPGDIAVAHKPDEFVEQSQLDMCDRVLRALCDGSQRRKT